MAPPHFLLDALRDSISSGTFIDTKFYVFSHRDADGRVCSPRALYCNSCVLGTVPYLSCLFSDGFSEAQMRDIDGGFPSDSRPYAEDYDYVSDSDLEDTWEDGEEPQEDSDGNSQRRPENVEVKQTHQPTVSNNSPSDPSSIEEIKPQNDNSANYNPPRMGKVAVIRDAGAITFEALLFFLYTDDIRFAPFSSATRYEPARVRVGDWSMAKLPSPSAKSIYRLADKYDIPALKERATTHIRNNLEDCDIVGEIFSSFTSLFPEILSMQVSFLVQKMNEESKGGTEGTTRERLRNKIASLSQSQLKRSTDTLAMIWNYTKEPPKPPTTKPSESAVPVTPSSFPNWLRVQLALLKSMTTGIFIDLQFYAYSKVFNNLPLDPKPLYASSIVIKKLAPAISKETTGISSQAACRTDEPIDDYESWNGGPPSETDIDELKYRTEDTPAESREILLLTSGAWKTWFTLFSFAYGNGMTFSPLRVVQVQRSRSSSPRSMYSLAATLGIRNVKEIALKDIQSKLSVSNITRELFSSFAESHKEIMEMEIDFLLDDITEKNPKSLTDYIKSVAFGESLLFPTTLSLVYDGLVGRSFPKQEAGGQSAAERAPRASNSTSGINPSPTLAPLPSTQQAEYEPEPELVPPGAVWLTCFRCDEPARVQDLYAETRCPRCPSRGPRKGRPFMQCPSCNQIRVVLRDRCFTKSCQARFV